MIKLEVVIVVIRTKLLVKIFLGSLEGAPWRANELQAFSWLFRVLLKCLLKLIGIDSVADLFFSCVCNDPGLLVINLFTKVLPKLLTNCSILYLLR